MTGKLTDTPVLLHRPTSDPSTLTLATSPQLLRSRDPNVPERLRRLLLSGTKLIVIADPDAVSHEPLYFELILRQSKTTYVVETDRRSEVGSTAAMLAKQLLPRASAYDWALAKRDERGHEESLPSVHTLEMAGVGSGDKLLLLGNHLLPMWAPAPPR